MAEISFLKAKVGHARLWPKKNLFLYNVFYTRTTIKKDMSDKTPLLLSEDRFNVLSHYTKDHGAKDKNISWYTYITKELEKAKISYNENYTIELIAHPRLLGYAFNPISYWLVQDEKKQLRAVMCEVRNTFKQSHNYLLAKSDMSVIKPADVLSSKKNLYVSPFNKVEGHYEFTFLYDGEQFKSVINYFDDKRQILNTFMGGEISTISSVKILQAVFSYPFMTIRVVARIHWQAVRLISKRVRLTLKSRTKNYTSNETSFKK